MFTESLNITCTCTWCLKTSNLRATAWTCFKISIVFSGVMVFTCVADDVRLKRSTHVSDTQLLNNATSKQVLDEHTFSQ